MKEDNLIIDDFLLPLVEALKDINENQPHVMAMED